MPVHRVSNEHQRLPHLYHNHSLLHLHLSRIISVSLATIGVACFAIIGTPKKLVMTLLLMMMTMVMMLLVMMVVRTMVSRSSGAGAGALVPAALLFCTFPQSKYRSQIVRVHFSHATMKKYISKAASC